MTTVTEPVQVSDSFIIAAVTECLAGTKHHAFGEPAKEWHKAFYMPYREGQLQILILNERPATAISESRRAVIEYARELIDAAYANGWTDLLEEWGVWQREQDYGF